MEKPFWKSATKITLLSITIAVILAPFFGLLAMPIVMPAEVYAGWMMVLGFYFGQKTSK